MPSTRRKTTKAGQVYYEIRCRISRDHPELSMRWYVPDGWGQRAIDRELTKQAAEFERRCKAGEILTRKEMRMRTAEAEREAASVFTLKQYGEKVFMPAKAITCSENTRSGYQRLLNHHIYPVLGDRKLPDITSAEISALLLSCQAKPLAHASCVKIYAVLNLLFSDAYMSDMIERTPMDKVKRPKPRKDELKNKNVQAYTACELNHILECLEAEPLKWKAYIQLLIDTGIRRGEACGLQWQYVDFKNNYITIAQNLCYTKEKGVYLDTPKSGKIRCIDVDPKVMNTLRRLRAEQMSDHMGRLVFTQDGSVEPMHPTSPTHYMRQFSKRYGIENMHPHKLRHSFASVAITYGADIASISEKLGHADKSTTLRLYTHANEESIKRAGDIFRQALQSQKQA